MEEFVGCVLGMCIHISIPRSSGPFTYQNSPTDTLLVAALGPGEWLDIPVCLHGRGCSENQYNTKWLSVWLFPCVREHVPLHRLHPPQDLKMIIRVASAANSGASVSVCRYSSSRSQCAIDTSKPVPRNMYKGFTVGATLYLDPFFGQTKTVVSKNTWDFTFGANGQACISLDEADLKDDDETPVCRLL